MYHTIFVLCPSYMAQYAIAIQWSGSQETTLLPCAINALSARQITQYQQTPEINDGVYSYPWDEVGIQNVFKGSPLLNIADVELLTSRSGAEPRTQNGPGSPCDQDDQDDQGDQGDQDDQDGKYSLARIYRSAWHLHSCLHQKMSSGYSLPPSHKQILSHMHTDADLTQQNYLVKPSLKGLVAYCE